MTQYAPPYALRVMTVSFGTVASANAQEQLGSMPDDAPVLLHGSWQKPGHVLERDQWNVEGVTEPHEAGALHRGIDVERPCQVCRLIRDDPDRTAAQTRKPHQDVPGVILVHLEQVPLVHDRVNDVEHVVRLVRCRRHDRVEPLVGAVGWIGALDARRIVDVIPRHEGQQLADQEQAFLVVLDREMRDAAPLVVRHRAAQFLLAHLLVSDRPDDIRTGDEHVARVLHHDDEVRDRG